MGRRPGSWDPPAWGGPWKRLMLAASVLGSCLQPAPAQTPTPVTIDLTPPSPVVGGGVSLAPQNPPQDVRFCSWYRSATTAEPSRIFTYFPPPNPAQQNGSAHTGRETAGPGCVLHIERLMLNYTGNYTVQIQTATSSGLGSVHLPVSEKLAKPMVTPNQNQVPKNGTLTLMFNTSPSTDTVLWLQNGSYLAPNKRLGLSPDNRTLMVQNFTWGDAGTYQCEVRNPVSTERSEPSTVTLPSPHYRWVLNSTELKETGSSLTRNLTSLDQQGTYKCQAQNSITSLTKNSTTRVIVVLEKLAKPTVTPNQNQVPENGTLTLTCNTSPSADTVLWLQNGSYIAPNKQLGLSPDNRTLTVQNFTWGDAGTYQCEVRNPVSTERSEPSTVTLAYGPESARIDPPGPVNLTLGSRLTLTCVADSVPAPSYSWFLNGNKLPQTGSSLTFDLTTLNSGTYKCQADNPVTGLTANAEIEVLEKLDKPTVTASKTQVPENGTLTLTCNTSPSADTVLWLQNGSYLAPNKRLGLSPDNRTLTVQNFTWGDAGTYQCEVRNPVSTERSEPSTVTLAYGPESARIDPPGPVNLTLGSRLTLTCVADSVPAPSYSWFLNGNKLPQTGSSLTFDLTTLNLGTYKCQADNPVTGLTANAEIEVLASPADSGGGLSPGAIAGIVIGSLAAAALIGGLLYFLLCRTGGETKQHSPVEGQAAPAQNQGVSGSKPTLGEEDIQYSTLAFSAGDQKPPPGPQTPREGGTVYSEIRKK